VGVENQIIRSIVRAVDVMELVGNAHEGVRLRRVASLLGLSRQSAYKILTTLVHKKFLTKLDSPPRYKLGPAMQALQERQDRWTKQFLIPGITKAIRLGRVAGSYVAIYQYVGGEVVSRFHSRGYGSTAPWTSYGTRVPPYGAAVVFQAYMDESERERYQDRHPLTNRDDLDYWKSLTMVNGLVDLIREHGYVAFLKSGNFRVAAPVFGTDGQLEAAVVVTTTYTSMEIGEGRKYVSLALQAAEELTAGAQEVPNS